MSTTKRHHWGLALIAIGGLGLADMLIAPAAEITRDAQAPWANTPRTPAPASTSTDPSPSRSAQAEPSRIHARLSASAPAFIADEKQRRLRAQRTSSEADHELGLDGPRPPSDDDLRAIQSKTELAVPSQLKAEQARRLSAALANRADATRERIALAHEQGDEAEAARHGRILSRLEQRSASLFDHSTAFESEAAALGDAAEPTP